MPHIIQSCEENTHRSLTKKGRPNERQPNKQRKRKNKKEKTIDITIKKNLDLNNLFISKVYNKTQ